MPTPLPNSAAMDALVEELLTKDVYIVDYLPRTVPQNSGGQYFDVEYYLLNSPRHTALKDKFSSVIFKLALLVFDWDCLNLSIYHPSAEMQQLLAPIAASEGLFFRAAET